MEKDERTSSIGPAGMKKGESFGLLGFDFRLVRSLKGAWRPQYAPKLKENAMLAKLREILRRNQSQPVGQLIEQIKRILRAG